MVPEHQFPLGRDDQVQLFRNGYLEIGQDHIVFQNPSVGQHPGHLEEASEPDEENTDEDITVPEELAPPSSRFRVYRSSRTPIAPYGGIGRRVDIDLEASEMRDSRSTFY